MVFILQEAQQLLVYIHLQEGNIIAKRLNLAVQSSHRGAIPVLQQFSSGTHRASLLGCRNFPSWDTGSSPGEHQVPGLVTLP